MISIRDHVYIVTGGGGAIAGSILSALAHAGARVAVVDRTETNAKRGAEAIDGFPIAADLTTFLGAESMVRRAGDHFGRVDGLIHTVGGFDMGPLYEVDPSQYDRMFDVNVRSLFYAVRAVLPRLMAQNDGFICGVSSEPGWTGSSPGTALYGAAKSAVATLLHSLDGELKGSAVRVAVLYPMGAVDTPANRKDMPKVDPALFIDPVEIGETTLFAASRGPRGRMMDFAVYPPR